MIRLVDSVKAWGSPEFESSFKNEIANLDRQLLPLQEGLSKSSHVSESLLEPVVLSTSETASVISVKTGIFYSGIIAGSCCADDPTPLCEENEYCEVIVDIDKATGEATIRLLTNQTS